MKYIVIFLICLYKEEQIKAQTDSAIITKPLAPVEKTQPDIDKFISDYYTTNTKAIIGLKDHTVLYVDRITSHLNEVMVEYDPKKIPLNPKYIFHVENVRYIKFTRGAFVKGLVAGAIIGAILGNIHGESSYNYDFTKSKDDNEEAKNVRKYIFGALGAIPFGLSGGFIGSIFIRKIFIINGDRGKMYKVVSNHMY